MCAQGLVWDRTTNLPEDGDRHHSVVTARSCRDSLTPDTRSVSACLSTTRSPSETLEQGSQEQGQAHWTPLSEGREASRAFWSVPGDVGVGSAAGPLVPLRMLCGLGPVLQRAVAASVLACAQAQFGAVLRGDCGAGWGSARAGWQSHPARVGC